METKISLVPTRTLYPQAQKEKKLKPAQKMSAKSKAYTKVYNEKDNIIPVNQDQNSPKAADNKPEHTFLCEFPRASTYSDMNIVSQTFPHLKEINKSTFQLDRVNDLKCFIMRSNNEDDIHKAIKYGIWTSTCRSNEFLNTIYHECSAKGAPVFLLYSVVRSGQFSAVAQMSSGIKGKHFQFWWEDKKWMNHFEVKWLFIKDVPYKCFNDLVMDDNTPVIRARDCTSIPVETAKEMLKIIRDYRGGTTIFDAFSYMDVREDMLRYYRYSMQSYHNRIPAKKPARVGSPQSTAQSSSKVEPLDHLGTLLKEFGIMLSFYQREENRLHQEIEELLLLINPNQELTQEDIDDFLPEYEDLKCRETEIAEGLEELSIKYQTISQHIGERNNDINDEQLPKNQIKAQDLEKTYRALKEGFNRDKEDMNFLSRKLVQLNVTSYQYNF